MGWVFVLYAGECQSCPEYERLPNDRPHNTDRTHGTRGEIHTDHTHLSLALSDTMHCALLALKCAFCQHAWIYQIKYHLMKRNYNKKSWLQAPSFSTFFVLLSLAMHFMLSHSCRPSTPLSFLSHLFKNNFSHWAKALIHLTLSKHVVLQWHSYYSPLPAPSPIPTVQREGVVLHPTCLTPSVDVASLASLGADSMGTQRDLMDDCLKMASCNGNRNRVWGLLLCFFLLK